MHKVRVPQETPDTPPLGLGIFRQILPVQRSAPVGPPDPMQKLGDEQDTLASCVPGGFFSFRQVVPFHVIASEWRTPPVVV